MGLQRQVREMFAPAGLLSQAIEAFQPREGQTDMATAVARTMDDGGVLVVEAGTGIGKTYSYLVPALLSGSRVLVSTATKTLQDQLFARDLPHLTSAMGVSIRAALLKGRASYLCLHRLDYARHEAQALDHLALRTLARIELWTQATVSGDLAELAGLDERSPVIPLVTSTRDNCLGSLCPKFRDCHVQKARREALAADLVVVNHHLFFADLAVRESGIAELLPSVRTVIFDEAHQLNETGIQFLGKQLSTGQLLDFGRDVLAHGVLHARGLADWTRLAADIEYAARDLRLLLGKAEPGGRLAWTDDAPEQVDAVSWKAALAELNAACNRVELALDSVSEMAPDLVRLGQRAAQFVSLFEAFSHTSDDDAVRWLELGAQLVLVEAPVDISKAVQTRMIKPVAGNDLRRSWVFTSATLGDGADLLWFTQACGLGDAEILKLGSPFDYARQAALYVPLYLSKPGDPMHSAQVADFVAKTAPVIGGRTLVLTTTLRALRSVSEVLKVRFRDSGALEILVQGQLPKRELMERFRLGNQSGRAGCILIASASFWEGVDVPGDALQMVVIDKLPFPPPSDPLVQARSKRIEAAGRSVFMDYYIPEAAVALKQGAGRLIRRESDRGVLVVCDTRLARMGYGRRLLKALPPMRKIVSEQDLAQALDALTRPSTMGQSLL